MTPVHGLHFDNIRGDIYGGVTAAVVALPLALAFGVASGAGPMAGLYGAIFVGFFAALFGGTPSQISGPTGPMTVVMALVITQYAHEPALAFTVVMMGGCFQILFGMLRLGGYIVLMPFPVVSGFMSGIGCIIIILQIAPLLGQAIPGGGTIGAVQALPCILANIHWDAALVGGVTLAIAILTPGRITRIMPAALIALVVGTVAVTLAFPGVPVLGKIPTGLPDLQLPALSWKSLPDMVSWALILALLGSIDSLLTSLVADSITQTHHKSDRELIGQGIGNMVAGLFGAIPGAGATMRTVVNVRAGGGTPISGVLHAIVLLAVVMGLGPFAGLIPHAVLAGILVKVGIDIIDWTYLRRVPRAPRAGVVLMFMVLGLTVFVDLIVAVTTGLVAASLLFVKRMSDLQMESISKNNGDFDHEALTNEEQAVLAPHIHEIVHYHLSGALSFGGAKGLSQRLSATKGLRALILDLTDVVYIDTSASLALEDIIVNTQKAGVAIFIVGIREPVSKVLNRLDALKPIAKDHIFEDRLGAFKHVARVAENWRPDDQYQTKSKD